MKPQRALIPGPVRSLGWHINLISSPWANRISHAIHRAASKCVGKKFPVCACMNSSFSSYIKVTLVHLLTPQQMPSAMFWERKIKNKTINRNANHRHPALANEGHNQKTLFFFFLNWLWAIFSVFPSLLLCSDCLIPTYHVRISEKGVKTHQKQQCFFFSCSRHYL